MELDQAVIDLLKIDPSSSKISSAGGGGCSSASTYKIITKLDDGTTKEFFIKAGHGKDAEVMFKGEHASLAAIHSAVPDLCPQSFGWGRFASKPSTYFLATDFLTLGGRSARSSKSSSGSGNGSRSLAQKLAQLHTTPAPTPDGYDAPQFGFPASTCCGDTAQDNSFKGSWAEFYADNRLRFIVRESERRNGADGELKKLVEETAAKVVPRLLGDGHLGGGKGVVPVVVHGDLWSGNASVGVIGGQGEPTDVVFDSSACYAHSEFELGIMKMFGGFSGMLGEYHKLVPKTEPVEEYEDRVALYELYHHLNHHALFGGGYKGGAVSIMKNLLRKYVK